jgi:hypothetical protein
VSSRQAGRRRGSSCPIPTTARNTAQGALSTHDRHSLARHRDCTGPGCQLRLNCEQAVPELPAQFSTGTDTRLHMPVLPSSSGSCDVHGTTSVSASVRSTPKSVP